MNIRSEILSRVKDENLRDFFVGMFAEIDAFPDNFKLDMFREALLVILQRQFERMVAENKKGVEEATKSDNQERILQLVAENTDLKENWSAIQTSIREWEPDRQSKKTTP